jgi:prepilin-type N-terminal cleavage/methylation domain-containing protein
MNRNLRARRNRGFTIVELIVVVTVLGLLAALAVGAYNTVVSQAKQAKSQALVSTLSTAKSLFVADPARVETDLTTFNGNAGTPDTQFTQIAPYIRVNGNIPKTIGDLLTFSGMPATVQITLGTVDDPAATPPVLDTPPTVIGYP